MLIPVGNNLRFSESKQTDASGLAKLLKLKIGAKEILTVYRGIRSSNCQTGFLLKKIKGMYCS